jgi:diketogulonate reductase-like aldo/keto reductase
MKLDTPLSAHRVPDLTMLAEHAKEPIAANQCHFGVGEMDTATIKYCKEKHIALESYGTLHGGVAMSDAVVTKIAVKHNVSTAAIMLKYVSQHDITIVTASDKLEYDEEDIAMFAFTLSDEDLRELTAIQGGKIRTCSDCWKDSCRLCQAALKTAGCTPWSNSTCLTCAVEHAKVVMPVCKDEAMVYKACINN